MEKLIADTSGFVIGIFKAITFVGFVVYIIFAFVVVKQVKIMTDTLNIGFEKEIRIISYVHFVLTVILFLISLVLLS